MTPQRPSFQGFSRNRTTARNSATLKISTEQKIEEAARRHVEWNKEFKKDAAKKGQILGNSTLTNSQVFEQVYSSNSFKSAKEKLEIIERQRLDFQQAFRAARSQGLRKSKKRKTSSKSGKATAGQEQSRIKRSGVDIEDAEEDAVQPDLDGRKTKRRRHETIPGSAAASVGKLNVTRQSLFTESDPSSSNIDENEPFVDTMRSTTRGPKKTVKTRRKPLTSAELYYQKRREKKAAKKAYQRSKKETRKDTPYDDKEQPELTDRGAVYGELLQIAQNNGTETVIRPWSGVGEHPIHKCSRCCRRQLICIGPRPCKHCTARNLPCYRQRAIDRLVMGTNKVVSIRFNDRPKLYFEKYIDFEHQEAYKNEGRGEDNEDGKDQGHGKDKEDVEDEGNGKVGDGKVGEDEQDEEDGEWTLVCYDDMVDGPRPSCMNGGTGHQMNTGASPAQA